jgi:ABC-type transport system involved in multi-copper enzyme maturation permease subunit
MLTTLIRKELKNILLSPKFSATFAVCAILIVLSIYVGIREYRTSIHQYETARQLVSEELRQQSDWGGLNNRTYRRPDPMQIFVSGIDNDIGRWSNINQFDPVKLRNSAYSDDSIFALFRIIDFSFIVQIVLSLFAFLFTYDAINGERETGTLALVFSNPIPRVRFLAAKLIGSWLGLVLPLMIPMAIGLLLLFLFGIPFDARHWIRLLSLLAASAAFFTFFVTLGVFFSAITRHSNVSFLLCLVAWVVFVFILPRAGVIMAAQAVTVPTIAEMEAQQDAYAKDRWEDHRQSFEKRFAERQKSLASLSKEDRDTYENDHLWNWMEEDDAKRKEMQKEIDAHGVRLEEDLRNRKAAQERLAFLLSRFSPASAYQLAVMDAAGTNIDLKSRYEDAFRSYRTAFNSYTQRKQKESGGRGGIRVTMDSEKGMKIDLPRERGSLNLTDLPLFEHPKSPFPFPIIDASVLVISTLLVFAAAVAGFLRYDLRS